MLEEDEKEKASYIKLLSLVQKVLEFLVSIAGMFEAPDRCKRKGVMVVFIGREKELAMLNQAYFKGR